MAETALLVSIILPVTSVFEAGLNRLKARGVRKEVSISRRQ